MFTTRINKDFSFSLQNGSVLPISLFILLVLTIIGATALNDTVMEEKMSSNFQQGNNAFQAAESATNITYINVARFDALANAALAAQKAAQLTGTPPIWPVDQNNSPLNPNNGPVVGPGNTTLSTVVQVPNGTNGGKLPEGCSLTNCSSQRLNIVATGTVAGTNVQRTVIQSVDKPIAQ